MLVKALEAEGIEWVFGIPGGEFLPFLEAIDRMETRITYVGTRHEQACGHMADAVARVTGKPAVACATVGPGVTHLVPGVDSAWADNIPMLVVHPSQSPKFEDHNRLQGGIDQLGLLRPLVKYQKHIANPNRVVWAAQKCFKELFSGRPGPCNWRFAKMPSMERWRITDKSCSPPKNIDLSNHPRGIPSS